MDVDFKKKEKGGVRKFLVLYYVYVYRCGW